MPFLNCLSRLRTLWSDARGNALMLTALALPVMIGAAGLGVHTMQLSHVKRELQREADSAAMAGAYSLLPESGEQHRHRPGEQGVDAERSRPWRDRYDHAGILYDQRWHYLYLRNVCALGSVPSLPP